MHKMSLNGNLQRSKRSLKTTRVYEDEMIKLKTLKTRRMVRDSFGENWLSFGEGHLTVDSSPIPTVAYRLLMTESLEFTHLLPTRLKSSIDVLQKKDVILGNGLLLYWLAKWLNFYSSSVLLLSSQWESVVVACGNSGCGGSILCIMCLLKEKLVPRWWYRSKNWIKRLLEVYL
ncbi:hypothetical protein M9H77_35870 [Catharanthus roseus]|uniref:Uncharacterized protein n=1 Tax=Catharanthus roseus TaxID=4058 RepID=A0ACB9ZQI2_CATRO|nr:hypothetical protein M9H77_35870 [Catharanthus roseus]